MNMTISVYDPNMKHTVSLSLSNLKMITAVSVCGPEVFFLVRGYYLGLSHPYDQTDDVCIVSSL